ncbi:NAD-dependent dehydratase, partial [Streptomyces sp. NPDC048845]
RLLTHGRVVRTTEMRDTLGFEPAYTTAEAFADFARSRGPGLLPPELLARTVDRLSGTLAPAGAGGEDDLSGGK